ncbi:MAG: DoxX family protein [Pseudomonadota bacterium]
MKAIGVNRPDHHELKANPWFLLGRIVLASLFVLGGIEKIGNPENSIAMMTSAGLPYPSLLIYLVIVAELGFGLIIACGTTLFFARVVIASAFCLIVHTALVNIIFHAFWTLEGAAARLELSLFFKNVGVIGGLVVVAAIYRRFPA